MKVVQSLTPLACLRCCGSSMGASGRLDRAKIAAATDHGTHDIEKRTQNCGLNSLSVGNSTFHFGKWGLKLAENDTLSIEALDRRWKYGDTQTGLYKRQCRIDVVHLVNDFETKTRVSTDRYDLVVISRA